MKSYRNNNRRGRYRNNDRNFKRKVPGRNNYNASKLIEKYNDLAREALSNGDKILSENYFQHADHFTRILTEQANAKSLNDNENQKRNKIEVVSDNTSKEEVKEKIET